MRIPSQVQFEKIDSTSFTVGEILVQEQQERFSTLLNLGFPVPPGQRYLDDFPIWDPKFLVPNLKRFGVFLNKKLVSCAGVRLAQLQISEQSLVLIGMIGAVATDKNWIKRGLASQVVQVAVDWAESQGAKITLLWGSEHRLYERLGFALSGKQVQIPLNQIPATRLLKDRGRVPVSRGWNPHLFRLRQERKSGLLLTEADRKWFQAHKNVSWFYSGSWEEPTAYAAVGRGIDLPGLVHEWGGDSLHLMSILNQIEQEKIGSGILGSPSLFREAGLDPAPYPSEYLCLAKYVEGNLALQARIDLPDFWIWGLDGV